MTEPDPVEAIGVLADQHARVLILVERGWAPPEIAARLGVEEAAVPALIRIAQEKLAELSNMHESERGERATNGDEPGTDEAQP